MFYSLRKLLPFYYTNVVLFRQDIIDVVLDIRIIFDLLRSSGFYNRTFGLNHTANVFFVVESTILLNKYMVIEKYLNIQMPLTF